MIWWNQKILKYDCYHYTKYDYQQYYYDVVNDELENIVKCWNEDYSYYVDSSDIDNWDIYWCKEMLKKLNNNWRIMSNHGGHRFMIFKHSLFKRINKSSI